MLPETTMVEYHQEPQYLNPPARCILFGRPPELLMKIFLYCLPPDEWGSFSVRDAPWLLTKVCSSWRELALSTTLLWSRLPFFRPPEDASWQKYWEGDGRFRLLELYIKNSVKTPLALRLVRSLSSHATPFFRLITPHFSRVQHLKLEYDYDCKLLGGRVAITPQPFPLLKSLELVCSYSDAISQSTTVGLEGFEFPWAQLTQLTIQVSGGIEALALFRNCRSLEVCHLSPNGRRTPRTPPRMKIIHHHLRTLIVEDGPFAEGLLGCLVTPALSTLEFIRGNTESKVALRSILLFIENSSAKLTSLTLCYLELSPQGLVDLSFLIPTIVELYLQGLSEESLESLDVESNLPYVLFPHLKWQLSTSYA